MRAWVGLGLLLLVPWGPVGSELYGLTQDQGPDDEPVAFNLLHWVLPLALSTVGAGAAGVAVVRSKRKWTFLLLPGIAALWLLQLWLMWVAAVIRTSPT